MGDRTDLSLPQGTHGTSVYYSADSACVLMSVSLLPAPRGVLEGGVQNDRAVLDPLARLAPNSARARLDAALATPSRTALSGG